MRPKDRESLTSASTDAEQTDRSSFRILGTPLIERTNAIHAEHESARRTKRDH
jgi:hypothetical protein